MRRPSNCWNVWRCAPVSTRATAGLFDPTVQPLWQLYADRFAAGSRPDREPDRRRLCREPAGPASAMTAPPSVMPGGMALTLNGVAQGFIADKVAEMLAQEGLTDILINTGELRALGQMPGAQGWPVTLVSGGQIALASRALATSSPLGHRVRCQGHGRTYPGPPSLA